MSINDAPPEEWDAIKADRYYDNRPYEPEDLVNKPSHYRVGEVEAIDYIAQQLGVGGGLPVRQRAQVSAPPGSRDRHWRTSRKPSGTYSA